MSHVSSPQVLAPLSPTPVWSFRPDGSMRDLATPDPAEICFFAMANGLSKIARFSGSNPGIAYSVAQHSVMGAEAILNETGDTRLAALFLLHDGEEHLLGDKTMPAQQLLLCAVLAHTSQSAAVALDYAWDKVKTRWREAGVIAARLALPSRDEQETLHEYDRRLCNAEAVALFGPKARAKDIPVNNTAPLKLKGGIRPWAAMKAEERFVETAKRLIGDDRLYEQTSIHAAHVAVATPYGPHAGEGAKP